MSNNDENDVLKRLRDVRRKLQESLNDQSPGVVTKEEPPKIETVNAQKEIEKEDRTKQIQTDLSAASPAKPKLYKSAADEKKKVSDKEYQQNTGVSRKRMANIQRRIRKNVESRKRMSTSRRAALVFVMAVAFAPIFMSNTLAFATCRFEFDKINLSYSEQTPGYVKLFLPVYNPSFLPARLGQIELTIYDRGTDSNVGYVRLVDYQDLQPFETKTLELNLKLNPDSAGDWISNLVQSFKLTLAIRDFKYNGVTLVSDVSLPEIDLYPLVFDLLTGLDFSSASSSSANAKIATTVDELTEIWKNAQTGASAQTPFAFQPLPSADGDGPSFELLNLGIGENSEKLAVKLDAAISIGALAGFDFGPIRIMQLDASLYGPSVPNATDYTGYTNRLARLSTLGLDEITTDFTEFDSLKGYVRNASFPVEVNLGRVSYAGARLEIFKDDIGTLTTHPSANLNFSDEAGVAQWAQQNKYTYSTWYFLYDLLTNGNVDVSIQLDALGIEIFGVPIPSITLPRDLIPIIKLKNLFDIDELLAGLATKPVGFFGMINTVMQTIGSLGMNIPNSAENIEKPVNLDDLGGLLGGFEFGGITEDITGDDANLTIGLGITLNNEVIDLHLGLDNLTLGISSDITNEEGETSSKIFAIAKATNGNGGSAIYINGLGSSVLVNIDVTLLTSPAYQPYVAQFVRDLIEEFTLKGKAVISIEKLMLFKENMTLAGVKLALGLDALGLDLKGILEDALSGLGSNKIFANPEVVPSSVTATKNLDPMTYAMSFLTQIMMGTPLLSPLSGINIPNMVTYDDTGSVINAPQSAQEIHIFANTIGKATKLTISISDLELDLSSIPLHIGLGYSYLEVLVNSSNTYGEWEPVIGLEIPDYIGLGPDTTSLDVDASLTIYSSTALCTMLDNLLSNKTGPSFSLKIQGSVSLNISGVYIPDLKLELAVKDLGLHLPLQGLIDDLIGTSSVSVPADATIIGPNKNAYENAATLESGWWDGDISKVPFASQDIAIDEIIQMGEFEILDLKETEWPHLDRGKVTVDLKLAITNMLMTLGLRNVTLQLYDVNNVLMASIYVANNPTQLMNNGNVTLKSKEESSIYLRLELMKSYSLQTFLNNILTSFKIEGYLFASLAVNIFDCTVGPITLNTSIGGLLDALGVDIASLLSAIIPFNEKTLRDSPHASADVMDLLGNFGLAYLQLERENSTESVLQNVGPLNYNDPMFTATAGLILQPKFNMSIVEADLYLCDAGIYNKIYAASGSNGYEAIKYSKIAQIGMLPSAVYANNTYAGDTDFSRQELIDRGINSQNYFDHVDPEKPYYNNSQFGSGLAGMRYSQRWYENGSAVYESYQNWTEYNYPGSFAMAELKLNLYNISHGSYETAYPKQYWRAMGGPYFPVQYYDKAHGGFPDHKVTYHPNYSPIGNLLSSVGGLLGGITSGDFAIGDIFNLVTVGGKFTINVFSMNVTLDANSPAVRGLLSALTTETFAVIMDEYKGFYDITRGRQSPETAYADRLARVAKYDDPKIPRLATAPAHGYSVTTGLPLSSEFYTDLEMNMDSIIHNYAYMGIELRNDHTFSPGMYGKTRDLSIAYMNNSRDMGSNINPWVRTYNVSLGKYQTLVRSDYKPGLVEFGGSNRERFIKDPYYDTYKGVIQNWAESTGNVYNPFFESENLSTWRMTSSGPKFDLIEDKRNWALRWYANKDDNPGACRTPTVTAIVPLVLMPSFELGLLSANINAWYKDTSSVNCGNYAPIGYIWLNQTQFPPLQGTQADNFWEENDGIIDEYANQMQNASWILANFRLFDSPETKFFITAWIVDIANFQLPVFVLDPTLNISLFGYESYNIKISGIALGDTETYKEGCGGANAGESGSTQTQTVFANGTTTVEPVVETPSWIPAWVLPKYNWDTFSLEFNIGDITEGLLAAITNDIFGFIMNDIEYLGGLKLRVTLRGAYIKIPLILFAWLTNLMGMVWINTEDGDAATKADAQKTMSSHWGYNGVQPNIDLNSLSGFGWWTELNLWYDDAATTNTGAPNLYYDGDHINNNPYNIAGNEQSWNPDRQDWSCDFKEPIYLPPVSVELDLAPLAIPIISSLLGGDPEHIWMVITYNQGALYTWLTGAKAAGITAGILCPAAFGYSKFYVNNQVWNGLVLDADLIAMDLGSLW